MFGIVLSQQIELYTKTPRQLTSPEQKKYVKTHKPQTPAANSTPRLAHDAMEQKNKKQMHAQQRSKAETKPFSTS